MMHNLKHNRVVHERVVFLTIERSGIPFMPDDERMSVTPLADGFWRVIVRHGFVEEIDVPEALKLAADHRLALRPLETTYFLGHETIARAARPGLSRWRAALFALMHRNAVPASAYFKLPTNRVVELGAQVEI
jgi:KUP system potassium uptake protein